MNAETRARQVTWACRFHPTDWWHEVGCPHRGWTVEQLTNALIEQKCFAEARMANLATLSSGTFADGVEAVAKAAERGFRSCGSVDLPGEIRALASKPAVVGARQMQILKIPQITADLMDTIDGLIDACDCPSLTAAEVRTCIKETLRTFLTENKPPAESAQPTPLEHNYVDKGFQWRVCDKCGMVENLEKKTVCKGVLPKLRPAVGLVEWKPKGEPTPAPASVLREHKLSLEEVKTRIGKLSSKYALSWDDNFELLSMMDHYAALTNEAERATAPPAANVGDALAKAQELVEIITHENLSGFRNMELTGWFDIYHCAIELRDKVEAALPNAAAHEGDKQDA